MTPTAPKLSPQDRASMARAIEQDFAAAAEAREAGRAANLGERKAARKEHRERLRLIHAHALEEPSTRDAAEFFLSDIYPEEAPAWRDSQALKALPSLAKFLPEDALKALSSAALLDNLTEQADAAMAQAGADASYEEAYVLASQGLRQRQIEALEQAGRSLAAMASSPFARPALIAMRLPARLGGLGDLQSFLERGLAAFEKLRDPASFVQGLANAELAEMRRIFQEK